MPLYPPFNPSPTTYPSSAEMEAGTGTAGKYALQATVTTAGPCAVAIPHALPVSQEATIGFTMRLSDRPTSVTVSVGYTDPAGNALPASTATLTADEVNISVGRFDRQVVHIYAPDGAATVGTIKVRADFPQAAGGSLALDAWTIEQGRTDGSYFDGDVLGGQWLGTPELSVSVLAPIVELEDGECPLDVPVSYELYNPALTGGRMTSPLVTLDSQGKTWLTHPAQPDKPVAAVVVGPMPDLTHDVEQGMFRIIGNPYPVVVSASTRYSPSGQLQFLAVNFAERDQLMAMFDDSSPVLLRAPANLGLGEGWWIVLGTITQSGNGLYAHQQTRTLTAGFQVVESPAGPNTLVA